MAEEKKPKPTGAGLQKTMDNIEKLFGKGSIMRMGDSSAVEGVQVISTGSLGLDKALGVGGVPRGRVVEIMGQEATGKCLPSDTRIASPYGLLTIEEIFSAKNLRAVCTNRTTSSKFLLYNRYGNAESTTHFTCNNRRSTFTVRTFSGATLRPTANQPQLIMSRNGFWVWKPVCLLERGDYLVSAREIMRNNEEMGTCSAEEAYLIGLILADGCLGAKRISLTNDDPCIKSFIEQYGHKVLSINPRIYPNGDSVGSFQYHFNCERKLDNFYRSWGWKPCHSSEKVLGKRVRCLDDVALLNVLRGYFDCECYIGICSSDIEVVSASRELLTDVKLLLQLRFGIISLLRDKYVSSYPNNNYWRLTISGDDARRFISVIGTKSAKRLTEQQQLLEFNKGSTNHDSVPNLGMLLRDLYDSASTNRKLCSLMSDYMGLSPKANVTYNRLKLIIDAFDGVGDQLIITRLKEIHDAWYYYDMVEEISKNDPEPTFDFAMSNSASINANGFVTHNTTLALQIVAQAQKAGGIAAFVDAEHALNMDMARGTGVDVDALLISQPDNGEQGLEITEALVRSGDVDVVVVDSVAALVPKAELAGDMGDSLPGLQARLMSQALRKLTGYIGKSKTVVIFINQLRNKIGVFFGSNETTTGGNALKFYATVRLDVRRVGGLKKGDEIIGNRVKVSVVKNKVSPPFRHAEFDLIFGKGIDQAAEVFDLAVDNGIVIKNGSWFNLDNERLGQGRDNALAFFKEHEDAFADLTKRVREKISAN